MVRSFHSFPVKNIETVKQQMLSWANRFNICCFTDNHNYASANQSHICLAGVGAVKAIEASSSLKELQHFLNQANDYVFGHFNFDLKNWLDDLASDHPDFVGFPDYFLFIPEIVLKLNNDTLQIGVFGYSDATSVFDEICAVETGFDPIDPVTIKPRIEKEDYIKKIEQLLRHIRIGDCYEINFCQEFYAENVHIKPLAVFEALNRISPNPFAAYYKLNQHYLLCASPERFLKKDGDLLISQPIKGTAPRGTTPEQDDLNKIALSNSSKDKSENVMVVDLVRNDLSKICGAGTVKVDELFGIYSFPNVHQMISTISGKMKPEVEFVDILKATFPMGSMTGAPKRRVLELTEKYEVSKRGIYSGSVGFFTPGGDFDFNVVIRSIMYNNLTNYLSYHVGGGITANSIPENEYEECLLKAKAIGKVLSGEPK